MVTGSDTMTDSVVCGVGTLIITSKPVTCGAVGNLFVVPVVNPANPVPNPVPYIQSCHDSIHPF